MQLTNHIIILATAFVLSLILNPVVITLCRRFSIYDYPRKHKRHERPTPNLGGTAIFISVWAAIIIYMQFQRDAFWEIEGTLPNIFAASLLIYLVGLWDDFRPLSAWVKLSIQLIAALILYFGGLSINILSLPFLGPTALDGFSVVITVLWVVALSNAVNLIDGLDGLAAGVSLIAAATMVVIGVLYLVHSAVLLSLSLAGALLAFWLFNRYPAKIFLGDSGSLLIGYFFAVISLVVPFKSYTTAAMFMPLVALGVPLIETVSSLFRRLAAGRSVMRADRRHIFHYLSHAGLSQRKIVNLFYLLSLFFGLISISMYLFKRTLVLSILSLFMVVIFILYFILLGRMKKRLSAR